AGRDSGRTTQPGVRVPGAGAAQQFIARVGIAGHGPTHTVISAVPVHASTGRPRNSRPVAASKAVTGPSIASTSHQKNANTTDDSTRVLEINRGASGAPARAGSCVPIHRSTRL